MESISRAEFFDAMKHTSEGGWGAQHHVAMIGPTGHGKSTVAKGLLAQRPGKQLILAPKGVDPTLAHFGKRVTKFPPPLLADTRPNENGPKWSQSDFVDGFPELKDHHKKQRIIRVEPPLRNRADWDAMKLPFGNAIAHVFNKGVGTLYIDELGVICDPKIMGMYGDIDMMMIAGRSRGATVLSAVQAPRWVPHSTYDQAQHVLIWRQRDKEGRRRLNEISGADPKEIEAASNNLTFYQFLWVNALKDEMTLVDES